MRIKGEYLQNLPMLVKQWAEDIDRLDVRISADDGPEFGASPRPPEALESALEDRLDASRDP